MKLIADAIVTNEWNETLLIRRDDTRTWSQPGGALNAGELPDAAAVREVEEETGMKVYPVRLVRLTFSANRRDDQLVFTFRCIQRGGQLRESEESLEVGFLPAAAPPSPMLAMHRERLETALRHPGGPPQWSIYRFPWYLRLGRPLLNLYLDVRNQFTGRTYAPPAEWKSAAFTVIRDEAGRVLWVRWTEPNVWKLPGGAGIAHEAPWQTAVRETTEDTGLAIEPTDLTGVYVQSDNQIVFVFSARLPADAALSATNRPTLAFFAPAQEPPNALPHHVSRVADAVGSDDITLFRRQDDVQNVPDGGN
jgi:ADP-ribose pyrophosphatase YjhB (NUDIX family)